TTLVTPNIPEAETLAGGVIETTEDMQGAAYTIVDKLNAGAALVKGGHLDGDAIDFLYDGKTMYPFSAKRVDTSNTHGTGCTLSAAITSYLSQDYPLVQAVHHAKSY